MPCCRVVDYLSLCRPYGIYLPLDGRSDVALGGYGESSAGYAKCGASGCGFGRCDILYFVALHHTEGVTEARYDLRG